MAYEVNWPGWDVVDKIGAGSFGAVYRIQRDILGEKEYAALKVISIPQTSDELEELQSLGYDDNSITTHFRGYLEDIVKEYSLMRKMKGNTNVVYCDDIQYIPNPDGYGWTIYIKMELLNPLMKNLHQVNNEAQVVKLAKDLCSALELCREQNILHRDIKPQNVFISDSGNFKLGDFGIAKTVERTSRGTKIGTYKYMAPEVFHNQPYGHNADIYSLGLLLYWLLNDKRTPFLPGPPQIPTATMEDEAMMRRFRGDPILAPAYGSPELTAVVLRACEADPAKRYQTAGEMLEDLRRIVPSVAPFATAMAAPSMATAQMDDSRTVAAVPVTYKEETEGTVSIFGRAPAAAPATPATPPAPVTPAATPAAKQAPAPKKKNGLLIILLILLAVAILVIGLLLLPKLLGSGNPEDTRPSLSPTIQLTAPTQTSTDPQSTDPTQAPTDPQPTDPTQAPTDPQPTDAPATVPNVIGMSSQQAVEVLEAVGLVVVLEYEYSEQVATDSIISQSIAADTDAQSGREIVLVVSKGSSQISIPDVAGKTQAAATDMLSSLGLKVTISQEYSDTVSAGTVIRQSPAAGSSCKTGTKVTLVISLGKDTIQSIKVSAKPSHLCYLVGDVLDTTGLKIQAVYASGKKETITSGFNCSPMSLNSEGQKSIQVTYNGLNTSFTVEVLGNVAASGVCGTDVRWALQQNGHLIIFGVGEMDPKAVGHTSDQPWEDYLNDITKLTIKDGVTAISHCAFFQCANLKTATMTDSVVSFKGSWQFAKCTSLESIRISKNITGKIGEATFMNCEALKEIAIPEGITSIGQLAFVGCSKLTSVVVPKNVTSIGFGAFYGTSSMESITILNPDCDICLEGQRALGGYEGTVIRGYAGSTAQAYAEKYPTIYTFEAID